MPKILSGMFRALSIASTAGVLLRRPAGQEIPMTAIASFKSALSEWDMWRIQFDNNIGMKALGVKVGYKQYVSITWTRVPFEASAIGASNVWNDCAEPKQTSVRRAVCAQAHGRARAGVPARDGRVDGAHGDAGDHGDERCEPPRMRNLLVERRMFVARHKRRRSLGVRRGWVLFARSRSFFSFLSPPIPRSDAESTGERGDWDLYMISQRLATLLYAVTNATGYVMSRIVNAMQ